MVSRKYPKLQDGEGFAIKLRRGVAMIKFGCCDCGLVHRIAFAVDKRDLGIAVQRDKRATAAARRHLQGLSLPKRGAF
jgi:cytochrome c1